MSTVADQLISRRRESTSKTATVRKGEVASTPPQVDEANDKTMLSSQVWFWSLLDFDQGSNVAWLVIFRLVQACTLTWNMAHPDQLWQGTQVAYNWVYGGVHLPWEWSNQYQLRNAVYPAFLAGPLLVLKELGLDSQMVVLIQPYLTHSLLVIAGDLFLWKSGKKYLGTEGTKIAMLLLLVCRAQTEFITRCFTNGVEQILSVIAFYFYLEQKNRFNVNTVMLTATITLSFMMRNTSPIGWIPLLAIKVLFEGALLPFLIAGVLVAIPIMGLTVYIDTLYYLGTVDFTRWVFTSYNFMKVNIVESLSEYFGTDPYWWYFVAFGPAIFTVMYVWVVTANFTHLRAKQNRGESPYLSYYNLFYFIVFSAIPHKELRFLIPIVPFAFLMTGELLARTMKKGGCLATLASLSIKLFIVVETVSIGVITLYHQRLWEWEHYLTTKGEPIHSVYSMDRFGSPHFSWFHGHDTRIQLAHVDPQFARMTFGHPLPTCITSSANYCNQIMGEIVDEKSLPEYILITEEEDAQHGLINFEICKKTLESLKRNGNQLYAFEKSFGGDLVPFDRRTGGPRQKDRYLYHLDTSLFQPF